MKAFVYENYGAPSNFKLKEVEKTTPQADEVLIKVEAVSLNPADWRRMRGDPFLIRLDTGMFSPKKPILGADVAGRVEAVGENVTRFKSGDEVFGEIATGGFAEYVCKPADILVHKPANLSFAEAAAVPLAGNTALQGLRDKGQIQSGQTVLVNGASGGVGTFAVQLAKSFGATVTGVCSTRNLELVRSIGADHVIDYTKEDFAQSGQRYDVVLDIVGDRSIADYERTLTPTGICVLIGFKTMSHMLKVLLQGMWLSRRSGQKITSLNAQINTEDLMVLKDLIESGQVMPVIDKCCQFNELPQAMAYLETGRARGKVVIGME